MLYQPAFIEFISPEGRKVYINPAHVAAVNSVENGKVFIWLASTTYPIVVAGTPEEVAINLPATRVG